VQTGALGHHDLQKPADMPAALGSQRKSSAGATKLYRLERIPQREFQKGTQKRDFKIYHKNAFLSRFFISTNICYN
jgi:hypothetical protein